MKKMIASAVLLGLFAALPCAAETTYENSLDHKMEVAFIAKSVQQFGQDLKLAIDSALPYLEFTLRVRNNEMGERDRKAKEALQQEDYDAALKFLGYDSAVTTDPKKVVAVYATVQQLLSLQKDFLAFTVKPTPDFEGVLVPSVQAVAQKLNVTLPGSNKPRNYTHPIP